MVKSLLPRDEVQGLASITGEAGSVLDFWKWAFSDLSDDDVKGWFAEWLVAKLIGVNTERRISWANSDIITPEGVRIEVQSSAYWQSWKLINEDGTPKLSEPLLADARTRVRFGGLFTADSVAVAKGTASHKSHLYVFAFHGERDPGAWDALNLSSWEFYIATREMLEARGFKTISLKTLETICPRLDAFGLAQEGKAAVKMIADGLNARYP